jgi:hypothetical protein
MYDTMRPNGGNMYQQGAGEDSFFRDFMAQFKQQQALRQQQINNQKKPIGQPGYQNQGFDQMGNFGGQLGGMDQTSGMLTQGNYPSFLQGLQF